MQHPDAKLLIVGTGELSANLQQLALQLGIANNVIFTGAVPNSELPAYFATADIFIGPSVTATGGDTEGFGLTFVEAGMSGCFVIGTDVGGIGDIIEHGRTGFLVDQKSPDQLVEIVAMILNNGNGIAEMKETARLQLCRKFCWPVIAEKYAKILSGI